MHKLLDISVLKGKTLSNIIGMEYNSEVIIFECTDGTVYEMRHLQDCCEQVYLEDVIGEPDCLLGEVILEAYFSQNEKDFDHETWTFYHFATRKGYVDLRWYGTSNGRYSERVDFYELCNELGNKGYKV